MEKRISIITGASTGIGLAVAENFSRSGHKLVLNSRSNDKLTHVCKKLNENSPTIGISGDCADEAIIERLFEATTKNYGEAPNCIVVNAGRGLAGSILTSKTEEWDELLRTNIKGALLLMRKGVEILMQQSGKRDIIVIGSCVGRNVAPRGSIYSATKFAVNAAAEALRREVCKSGIRVTLIEPGVVTTEFRANGGYQDTEYENTLNSDGPLINGDDIARLISFVIEQPAHVHIHDIGIRPARQEYP